MADILIRKAVAADYEAVEAIMQQVQQLHVAWRPDIYRPCETVLAREDFLHSTAEGTFFVATMEDAVRGVMEIGYRHVENPVQVTRNVIYVHTMAVDEGFRGQGIGHAFFACLKEMKARLQLDGIELQVNARNKAAYDMYVKCGFTEKSINMELL